MSEIPTISITDPNHESTNLSIGSPSSPPPPGSPTVFDVVKDMEALDRDDLIEEETIEVPAPEQSTPETNEAALDETSTIEPEETAQHIPEQQLENPETFYHDKTVLLTGATGFVGKALLWKLLMIGVKKVFILVRPIQQRGRTTVQERLQEEILANKAFVSLRRSMGPTLFDRTMRDKIHPIEGDLLQRDLGLTTEDRKLLVLETNVIFHCAAVVDGNERLDLATQSNVLGTMNLMEIANECMRLSAFIHMSPLQSFSGFACEDRLLPLNQDPSEILHEILSAEENDLSALFDKLKSLYPDTYLLSKSLAEHMLIREVERKRSTGGQQYPVAIMRFSPIGPSVAEPLMAWADGVNGANGTILLTGRGIRVIPSRDGDLPADIVPVDYAVRMVLGCTATIVEPKEDFSVPTEYDESSFQQQQQQHQHQHQRQRSSGGSVETLSSPIRDSKSTEDISFQRSSSGTNVSSRTSVHAKSLISTATFPYIYHVTMASKRCLVWKQAYEPIRQYWTATTAINLPTSQMYFASTLSGAGGLVRAKTMMNSLRSAASSYMSGGNGVASIAEARNRKRSSQRLSRCIDKATKLSLTAKSTLKYITISDTNAAQLSYQLQATPQLDPHSLVPQDVDHAFWNNYFLNACYGVHYYVCQEPDLRLPSPLSSWMCALQVFESNRLIDTPAQSGVFSNDQVAARTARMVAQVKAVLDNNASRTEQDEEDWLRDMDDSLDDWCQDGTILNADKDKRAQLGKWRRKVGSNDESVKVVVLNDKRVNQAIHQITKNAGVQKQTAVNEAIKILARMSERTQLAFVWFAGYFLKSLFDDMFENIRIHEDSIRNIRTAMLGKRVVYVPVTRSVLDPLLVWYVAIRYHLPVPAFACDESLVQLGPISDIYRLAGAYYIKRDKSKRSPLNTAVMAAYTQVLLREHGALSLGLEKSRSRTGKYQEAYHDGLIEMVIESTLQSNQQRTPIVSRVASLENSPPATPDTPDSLISPTMSVDSNISTSRKVHRDVIFVPINMTYENVPELPYLLDDVLDQKPTRRNVSQPASIMRPSEAMDKRNKILEGGEAVRKHGRVLFGIGPLVSVQEAAEEVYRASSGSLRDPSDEATLVEKITREIQINQRKALVASPASLVAAVILYGRATSGVSFGKIKDMATWLKTELVLRGYQVDWQDGEDTDAVIFYAFRLLDEAKNLIIENKEITDDTNIRVNDHADNVMTLSYYANQITDVFLLDAFFAVVYLSFTEDKVIEDEFNDRFRFLVQLLEREFVVSWDIDEQFNTILSFYEQRKVIKRYPQKDGSAAQLRLVATMESNSVRYEQLVFLASLIYPTIDSYWITSCSLSALEAVPMLPRSIVPQLAQWIATHLITGRRTIYREVLSTESSRTAAEVFMTLGFLTEVPAKERLSPDAQIQLHELGIPTTETLIELSGQNSDGGKTPVSPADAEGMMKALMAQIQMNRANSNMADLCQQIDSYRLGTASHRETFQNKQVFQRCLKQIKGILQASSTGKRHVSLPENEAGLVQLVYALRTSSMPAKENRTVAGGKAWRRISEAYNLRQ